MQAKGDQMRVASILKGLGLQKILKTGGKWYWIKCN